VLETWKGQEGNFAAAQAALLKRSRLNGLARDGQYRRAMEAAA
jgi:fructose-bisphosphate aldolase class I